MTLNEISEAHHQWLEEMGWTGKATELELVTMLCSEILEAINACRENNIRDLSDELADVILRTMGIAERLDIDIQKAVLNKMEKNSKRSKGPRIK